MVLGKEQIRWLNSPRGWAGEVAHCLEGGSGCLWSGVSGGAGWQKSILTTNSKCRMLFCGRRIFIVTDFYTK